MNEGSSARTVGRLHQLFAYQPSRPRSRRATDVILLIVSALALAVLGAAAEPQPGFEHAFETLISQLPSGLDALWRLPLVLLLIWSAALLGTGFIGKQWAVARDLILAGAIAVGIGVMTSGIVLGDVPSVLDSLRTANSALDFPPLGLSVPGALVIVASPHLTRPARQLGRWLIGGSFVGVILLGASSPSGAAGAVLVAALAGAVVHLALGSSAGRPSVGDVSVTLTRLSVVARDLGVAQRQPAGSFVVDAVDGDGEPLVVKVFGRDAYDTQLLNAAWRKLWYREVGGPTSLGRLQQAEHEALLTLLAAQAGVHTQSVVTASQTRDNDVILVLGGAHRTLSELTDPWPEGAVESMWAAMTALHKSGMAHGQLDDEHFLIHGDAVGLIDFAGASLAPRPEQLRTDEAQLLVATALAVGPDRATSAALAALGADGLTATLRFLQVPALTPRQRRQVKATRLDLDSVGRRAAEIAEVSAPELQKMRRVTLGSIVQIGLLAFAFWALASAFAGMDLADLAQELKDATWWLIALGTVLAQTPRVSSAVAVLGAAPIPMPLGPVYALQLATSYVALAIPSTAARVALNIRFFQRHGLPAGTAVAVGALDGSVQILIQVLLLIGLLLLTPLSLHLDLASSGPSSGLVWLIVIFAVLAVVAIVVIAVVHRWRAFVIGWVRRLATDAAGAVRGLHSPRRLAMLIGGNLATEILFALALQTIVRAFGYQIGLAELVLINVSVSLLSNMLPIPGGIGVVEGGLTLGLVEAGMPQEVAFAAVLTYRFATFYLPPIWGFFALRWLERNKQI